MGCGDAEQGAEGSMGRAAAVEAEDELIEIGLKMLAAQAVVDAQSPDLEVGEDAVGQGRTMCAAILPMTWGSCFDTRRAGVSRPPIGLGGGAGSEIGGEEGVQAVGRIVGHLAEADAAALRGPSAHGLVRWAGPIRPRRQRGASRFGAPSPPGTASRQYPPPRRCASRRWIGRSVLARLLLSTA